MDYYSHLTTLAQTSYRWVFELSSFFFCKIFYKAPLPLNITPHSCLFLKLPRIVILMLWRSLKKNRFSKLPFKRDGPFVKVAVLWVSTIGIFLLPSHCHGLANNCRCHLCWKFLIGKISELKKVSACFLKSALTESSNSESKGTDHKRGVLLSCW